MTTKSVATSDADAWEEYAVYVKLPTFCTSDPLAWFQHAEAQFGVQGITTDDTKFWHVLTVLDANTSAQAQA